MSNYYTVKLPDDRTIMHVKAKTKAAARNCALEGLEVVRLSTDDVLDIHRRGLAIVSADTGKVCNGDPEQGVGGNVYGNPLGVDAE